MKKVTKLLALLFALLMLLSACNTESTPAKDGPGANSSITIEDNSGIGTSTSPVGTLGTLADIPRYSGGAYVTVGNGTPGFTAEEIAQAATSYEAYTPLDSLGRCTVCIASVGKDLMPTEERESISSVKPSGWINVKYDTELVDGGYIYNRCHLIGFQLTGENARKENLITGTRYLNIEGMLPFENMIADYVKETGNHVLFRVTPVFDGYNLVASGVLMEALSIEDGGEGISFAVFAYNVQPGIVIDYKTGESRLADAAPESTPENSTIEEGTTLYVLNTGTKKIHRPECSSVSDMASYNRQATYETIASLTERGFTTCGSCKPE